MRKRTNKLVVSLLIIFAAMLMTGCSKIIRENIISSINTGIGATLAENPQTQLYEVKVGYIRSQFYSIPTGKMILEEKSTVTTGQQGSGQTSSIYSEKTKNEANITPELVSGIKVRSGAEHLFLGVDVSENFAVGKEAVNSKAATAMYIAESKDAGIAGAASLATGYKSINQDLLEQQESLDLLLKKNLKPNPAEATTATLSDTGKTYGLGKTKEYADDLAAKQNKTVSTIRRKGGQELENIIDKLKAATSN